MFQGEYWKNICLEQNQMKREGWKKLWQTLKTNSQKNVKMILTPNTC